MGAGTTLSREERRQILEAKESGLNVSAIARSLNRSRGVVNNFLKDPDGYHTTKIPGRPRKLSHTEQQRLLAAATSKELTAKELRDSLALPISVGRINGYLRGQNGHRSSITTGVEAPEPTQLLPTSAPTCVQPQRSVASLQAALHQPELVCTKGFIGGKWVDALNHQHFPVIDPATDQAIALVTNMEKENTYAAIAAALEAQRQWKKTAPQTRSELLKKWHAAILENADDLAAISSAECGKPLPAAKKEVADAAEFVDYSAHEMMHPSRIVASPSLPGQKIMVTKEPVGVCGIVTSWNFPLAMVTRKLGPCLAAGCTTVVKPSAKTPLSALALAKLAEEVGIPAGVINVVPSSHDKAAEVGEALTTNGGVRKIVFTGSIQVGKLLMQQSAANAKQISLELSGNASFIVFEDADVDKALDGLMASKFRPTVQTCMCTNRIFVHKDVYDEFATRLVERVRKVKMGLPRDEMVQLGPLISSTAFQKTLDLVDDAMKNGAKVLVGGKPDSHGKNFYEPTVLVNVDETMRVWSEEIIGPVIPLFEFSSEEEVLGMANDAKANLASYFFSRDLARTWRVAAALECDAVGVNMCSIPNMQTRFGGVTQSGVGRGGSRLGLEEFQDTKMVYIGGLEE